jgi:hypothetical protein
MEETHVCAHLPRLAGLGLAWQGEVNDTNTQHGCECSPKIHPKSLQTCSNVFLIERPSLLQDVVTLGSSL